MYRLLPKVSRSRRRRPVALAVVGGLAATLLAACGSSSSTTSATSSQTASESALLQKYGVAIPQVTVPIAMMPFADNLVMSVAMHNNWLADNGITAAKSYATIDPTQQVALMLKGTYPVTSNYGPTLISTYQGAPSLQLFAMVDDNVGQAILANPKLNDKSVSDFMSQGMSFTQAAKAAVAQMSGKRFATDNNGSHRGFVNTIFKVAGFNAKQLGNIQSLDDSKMLALANGGGTDFAKPLGNAQLAQLEAAGWKPIITQGDLMDNLPAGDPDAVTGLGNEGLSTTTSYYEANKDTIMRLAAVLWRVADAITSDVKNGTTTYISSVVPVLNASAGLNATAQQIATVYKSIDPMLTFEDQKKYWLDPKSPYYYKTVYDEQIKAAIQGGVITDKSADADDIMGIGAQVFKAMYADKQNYDSLVPSASGLTADKAQLAAIAKEKYDERDYLDADLILKAALGK